MRIKFALSLALLLISLPSLGLSASPPPQENHTPPFADALRSFEVYARERMAYDRIPGLSVGFIKDGHTWAEGFGYADLENKVMAGPESSYRIASITKTITALAVLQLVQEGKIDLDAEIQKYVPYFPRKKWPVTVRQLLGHLGGISHYKNYAVEGTIKEPKTTRESIAIFQDFDLVAEPGTRYNYSSYGYNLLGAAIEEVSRLPYEEFIKKHIFDPLEMKDSRLDNPADLIPNRVKGYRLTRGELRKSEFVDISSRFAAAGARSTVADLLKYARGICEGKLLQKRAWKMMFSSMAIRSGYYTWCGMAWGVQPWQGHFAVSHSGFLAETRAFLLIFPVDRFAVAIACNLEGANLMPYAKRLTELILDEDIDSSAYAPDKVTQAITRAISDVFSYGLSLYKWNNASLATSANDLREAFTYFNDFVNARNLRQNYKDAREKILVGIHLASNQAFSRVGSYMAQALEKKWGKEKLLSYHRQGPLAFFSDYIKLSTEKKAARKHPRFNPEFIKLIAQWETDWNRTHTDYARHLSFSPASDFEGIISTLKKTFSGASFYPDFTSGLAEEAEYFLRANDPQKASSILNSALSIYPASPSIQASLGFASFCMSDSETGRKFYKKGHDLSLNHPSLSPDRYLISANLLMQRRKPKEAIALLSLALEYYPKEARFYTKLGDLSLAAGQKDRAVEFYQKALKVDPDNEDAKTMLKKLDNKEGVR